MRSSVRMMAIAVRDINGVAMVRRDSIIAIVGCFAVVEVNESTTVGGT